MLVILVVLANAVSCGSFGDVQLCGEIPEGGCPIGRGGSCDDDLCAELYDCVEGEWTGVTVCHDGVGSGGGGGGGGGDDGVGHLCEIVVLDHTGETTGCEPDLLGGDCPLAAAELCAESACLTDCYDFFLCTEDGWLAVAYCNENGEVVVTPP